MAATRFVQFRPNYISVAPDISVNETWNFAGTLPGRQVLLGTVRGMRVRDVVDSGHPSRCIASPVVLVEFSENSKKLWQLDSAWRDMDWESEFRGR